VALRQFWNVLPAEARRRTLATLSRIVAEHLPTLASSQEVGHDRR
jgi:hypothetical protein